MYLKAKKFKKLYKFAIKFKQFLKNLLLFFKNIINLAFRMHPYRDAFQL
jgi:hypothetical protein